MLWTSLDEPTACVHSLRVISLMRVTPSIAVPTSCPMLPSSTPLHSVTITRERPESLYLARRACMACPERAVAQFIVWRCTAHSDIYTKAGPSTNISQTFLSSFQVRAAAGRAHAMSAILILFAALFLYGVWQLVRNYFVPSVLDNIPGPKSASLISGASIRQQC